MWGLVRVFVCRAGQTQMTGFLFSLAKALKGCPGAPSVAGEKLRAVLDGPCGMTDRMGVGPYERGRAFGKGMGAAM